MAGSCEHGEEIPRSVKGGKFVDYFIGYRLLEDSAPRSHLSRIKGERKCWIYVVDTAIVIADNIIVSVIYRFCEAPIRRIIIPRKNNVYFNQRFGFRYRFLALSRPWHMRSGSDYVASWFVPQLRHEYEHFIEDLKKDNT
jgi:hypothetical protein